MQQLGLTPKIVKREKLEVSRDDDWLNLPAVLVHRNIEDALAFTSQMPGALPPYNAHLMQPLVILDTNLVLPCLQHEALEVRL